MVFDTIVNQITKQYNLPASVAALRIFSEIRDYDEMGGLSFCVNQNQAIGTLMKLRNWGITKDRILYLNNLLEKNGYNIDMKSTAELDSYRNEVKLKVNFL